MELTISPWRIETGDSSKDFRESIFSQANGTMGLRGYAPEDRKENTYARSVFLAGFFEYIRPGITDMVNQPDISAAKLLINGTDVSSMTRTEFKQSLDMRDGSVCWEYTATDAENRETRVKTTRFLSMARRHIAAFRFELTPVNHGGIYKLDTGIDCDVENLPIADDQLSKNTSTVRLWGNPEQRENGVYIETVTSKRGMAAEFRLSGVSEGYIAQGKTAVIDKVVSVYSFRDGGDPAEQAVRDADEAIKAGYDALLTETRGAWNTIWDTAGIELDADEEWQGAVRYNIFQLVQAAPHKDPYASIGARGLTHGRYKGCYFWDTEIFMLPFYLYTDPETARNMLLYRYNTLQDSIENAKRLSLAGARYSWMTSDTGFEQCESWDTGCCEIHITADIAYAFGRYVEVTGDTDFLVKYAAEVYIQTARYWVSRFTYNAAEDRYNLLFVKGPDEYCGVTNNNLYTVRMAEHNLRLALGAVALMKEAYPAEWAALRDKTGYQDKESARWEDMTGKVVIRYDEELKLFRQDDVFELLEPVNPANHKNGDAPLYHTVSFDKLQRYQVLKQPDVLMLMQLLPGEFTAEQKKAAWDYYEPKTLHDSTLSFGAHALMAARIGLAGKAEEYLAKSGFLDLKNIMGNTGKEGLHTAAQGITWQALVFGLAGLWVDANGIRCEPKLPDSIRGMRFRFIHGGIPHTVSITKGKEGETKSAITMQSNADYPLI